MPKPRGAPGARGRSPGISRIDQEANHTHGCYARLRGRARFFSDLRYGGMRGATVAAEAWMLRERLRAEADDLGTLLDMAALDGETYTGHGPFQHAARDALDTVARARDKLLRLIDRLGMIEPLRSSDANGANG